MDTKYNITFADNISGRIYGINFTVTETGFVNNTEIIINPNSGCATRTRKIPNENIQVNRLEKIAKK